MQHNMICLMYLIIKFASFFIILRIGNVAYIALDKRDVQVNVIHFSENVQCSYSLETPLISIYNICFPGEIRKYQSP